MTENQIIALFPQIQAAFAAQGITITLAQVVAIVEALAPLFTNLPPPVPVPPPPIPPPVRFVNLNIKVNVPGAVVKISQDDGNGDVRTTDGNGFCNFGVVALQPQTVTTTAVGYIDQSTTITPLDDTDFNVTLLQNPSTVKFDHDWTGNVELKLREFLSSGLAGGDGMNGQAVIDKMNSLGGIYSGGEFQQHHDGPQGFPTYGFSWFYVSYVPGEVYQIVVYGQPPVGD